MKELEKQTIKELMYEIFPNLGKLPIKAGWATNKEDSVIINNNI